MKKLGGKVVSLHLLIPEEEVQRIDQWRATKQIWSRSDAIRKLLAKALNHVSTHSPSGETSPQKSRRSA